LIKVLLLFLLITTSQARENPFFPSAGERDVPYTSNEDKSVPSLKRATIELPPYARIVESVTINYKNLDGSQESRNVKLNNSIDWHLPIFISQSYGPMISKPLSKAKKKSFKRVASIKFATFLTSGKTLRIITKDALIRNFLLVKPHRIVLDFKRDANLKTYVKENKKNVFTKIRVGNHSGYYRVVVELDGYYRYSMRKTASGYDFKLK